MTELLHMTFERASRIAQARSPLVYRFGYFAWHEAARFAGRRPCSMLWFGSRSERLTFFTQRVVGESWLARLDSHDRAMQIETLGRILSDAVGSGLVRDRTLNRANQFLPTGLSLRWWGDFAELFDGDSEFAKAVRQWHRLSCTADERESADLTRPLRFADIDAFVTSISTASGSFGL
jgi:hypothetical protein